MTDGQLVNYFDNYGLITIYVHGVNSNHVGYDSLRSTLKSRISIPTNMFEQYSIDMNWAISNGKGGFINPISRASDSIGSPRNWIQGLSAQQWRAVTKLKKIAQKLRKVIKSDRAFCNETVNIVAHSQGTLISLAALQQGLKIDYVIFMGSPMDKEIIEKASHNTDIEAGARNTQKIINMWSTSDDIARLKGGIGGFGPPKNKISAKVIDIRLNRVDHFGKTGWWNGSWLDNGSNLKTTEEYWNKVLYTATDPSRLSDKTKETIKKIQSSASSYMSR